MANITLFPANQKPINFAEATGTYVQSGILYFRAKKDPNVRAQSAFTTNLPFVLVEEDSDAPM